MFAAVKCRQLHVVDLCCWPVVGHENTSCARYCHSCHCASHRRHRDRSHPAAGSGRFRAKAPVRLHLWRIVPCFFLHCSWSWLSTNAGWQQNFWSICRIFTFFSPPHFLTPQLSKQNPRVPVRSEGEPTGLFCVRELEHTVHVYSQRPLDFHAVCRWQVLFRQQGLFRQQANMDCQLRFVESIWQNKLGCIWAIVIGTWRFSEYDVDFAITLSCGQIGEVKGT